MRGHPKNQAYWPGAAEIAQQLPDIGERSLCYELGPTGSIHAGILRAFYFAERIQETAKALGKSIKYVLRLNDLAPAKSGKSGNVAYDPLGAGIAAEALVAGRQDCTMLDNLHAEIETVYARTGWTIPEIVKVSELYRSIRFKDSLQSAIDRNGDIFKTLSRHKQSDVSMFYPICPSCRRVRSSQPIVIEKGFAGWQCRFCQSTFEYVPTISPGLVTFKLEQALIWQSLVAAVDLHGQDHIEAFDTSLEIATMLNFLHVPLPARINLVFDSVGAKLSKSKSNFKPVVTLSGDELRALILKIENTEHWLPMEFSDKL